MSIEVHGKSLEFHCGGMFYLLPASAVTIPRWVLAVCMGAPVEELTGHCVFNASACLCLALGSGGQNSLQHGAGFVCR